MTTRSQIFNQILNFLTSTYLRRLNRLNGTGRRRYRRRKWVNISRFHNTVSFVFSNPRKKGKQTADFAYLDKINTKKCKQTADFFKHT